MDSKQGTSVWLEKGVTDADGSTVMTVLCKLISKTLPVSGQLKADPGRDHDPEP